MTWSLKMLDYTPAPFPELNNLLADLLDGIRPILGGRFLGAYLQGSFAHGGWDQDSDVDFVVVIRQALTAGDLVNLQKVLAGLHKRESCWAHHLEGSYFPADVLSDLSANDVSLDYLDNGSLDFENSTHDNSLVVRRVLRRRGVDRLAERDVDMRRVQVAVSQQHHSYLFQCYPCIHQVLRKRTWAYPPHLSLVKLTWFLTSYETIPS
jgi:predicted nucleotidyltransferase